MDKIIAQAHRLAYPPVVIVDNDEVSPKILEANPQIESITLNPYFFFRDNLSTTEIKLKGLEIPNLIAEIDPNTFKIQKLYIMGKQRVSHDGDEWTENYYIDVTGQLEGEF